MKNKKLFALFLSVIAFLFCAVLDVSAQEPEGMIHIPGTLEGVGKHFEITDSEYLNIILDSSEEISAKIESAPEMITIEIRASANAKSANLAISGFASGVTYHKYEDNYHNYTPFTTDENGAFSFSQDIGQNHIIFIQPRKSTKFIKDNATGGDCSSIGNWNASSKTCTLTKDLNETVQIDNDGITLDGNGHKITGKNTGNGVYVRGSNVAIKNSIISNFFYGIYLSKGGSVISNKVTNNYYGVYVYGSKENILNSVISNNSVSDNKIYGISLFYTENNNIFNNIVGPNNRVGLFQTLSGKSEYESNDFFGNQIGVVIYGNYNNFYQNVIHENSQSNFYIKSDDMATNNVGIDNTIDGKPIYYEKNISGKTYDNSIDIGAFYCANCQNITIENVSLAEKEAQITFWNTNNSLIKNVSSGDKSVVVEFYYSSNNIIEKNTFKSIKIYKSSNENKIFNNNIMTDDSGYTVSYGSYGNLFYQPLPVGGNYWKSNEYRCRDLNNDKICDTSFFFNGGVDNYPWAREFDFSESSGNSNVLFLPGIKASKLYKDDSGDEDQLWPPNYFGSDVDELMLDENGKSIENVYTKDVLESTIDGNIYESFIENLKSLKDEGKINDYKSFAYDWRQSADDVAKNGTPYQNIIKSLTTEIQTLSDSSKNKKVTIVAHSNGGLVAKAAMLELQKMGLADKVDKIIFVATPQMGTPITTFSMLYGYDESLAWGTLMSQKEARKLVENMPGAYGLLPSEKYFQRTENPFITFSSENTRYKNFKDAYGENIDNLGEFKNFLLGADDHRTKPEEGDTESENILNQKLLEEAIEMHEELDNWTPPASVQVVEIAGWGLDTISGVDYTEKEKTKCYAFPGSKIPSCTGMGEYEPIYDPKFTVDGDKVVVSPSALMFPEAENVKRYWVDLWLYDDPITIEREHKDILEIENLRQFISNILTNTSDASLPEYIKTSRPDDYKDAKPRIRMSLYSPLDIHLYDDKGNHTGPKKITDENGNEQVIFEENISNSYYYQFGDRKYVGVPAGEHIRVEMDGYALGAYTLKLEEVKETATGEETISKTIFENFPTTTDTIVKMDIPETGIAEKLSVKADIDSDGKDDYVVDSVPGGTVEFPDLIAPEITVNSPENKDYVNNEILKLDYSIIDNISNSENIKTEIFYDGKIFSEKEIDLSLQNLGEHKIAIFAEDEAGNKSNVEIAFNVISNIDAISQNIEHYFDLKLIADGKTKDFLQVKINEIDHVLDMIEKMDGKNNENPKANQIKLLNKKVADLIGFVQGKFGGTILSPAKEVLVQSLNFIKK